MNYMIMIWSKKANYSIASNPVFSCEKFCNPSNESNISCDFSKQTPLSCVVGIYPNYNYEQCPIGSKYCQVNKRI